MGRGGRKCYSTGTRRMKADDREIEVQEVFRKKPKKTREAADENYSSEKGKGVLCQEKCANLMQLKEIFKETL
jgi:hypothetical protein